MVLLYATQRCFSHYDMRGDKRNPYKVAPNDLDMMAKLHPYFLSDGFDIDMLRLLLSSIKKTVVHRYGEDWCANDIKEMKCSIVVVMYQKREDFSDERMYIPAFMSPCPDGGKEFECRYVFCSDSHVDSGGRWKAQCFARHERELFLDWWIQKRGEDWKFLCM